MKKLLVVCGPTSTGKTKLALSLAKEFNGTLISADSRQVYKYMDIGTGKGEEKVLGYDLVNPNEEFSVSQYVNFANKEIQNIYKEGKLPILVGGTGLYIKSITDGIETADVPPNEKLREELSKKSVKELFELLEEADSKKAISMNESDRKNPRRLVRAIEIANYDLKIEISKPDYDILFIGLTTPLLELKERIEKRVDERIEMGFQKEIDFLKNNGFWEGAPQSTLGYREWPDIDRWKLEEFKYAKRQMTWFKKNERINWFNITDLKFKSEVENLVRKWYSQSDA